MISAYESIVQEFFVDEIPERIEEVPVVVGYDTQTRSWRVIGDTPYSGIDFIWTADSGNYSDLNTNINGIVSNSLWYDPEEYNGEDAILQSRSTLPFSDVQKIQHTQANYVVSETHPEDPDSPVYLVAGTLTESREMLLGGDGDRNLNLYFNMLRMANEMLVAQMVVS